MCDEIWFGVEIVKELAKKLLPERYALRRSLYDMHRFEVHLAKETDRFAIAAFSLSPFPGCECAAVISHGSWVDVKHRRKGLGTTLLQIRTEAIKQAGYGSAFATVRRDNLAEKRLLILAGWRPVTSFLPKHSDSLTELWALRPKVEGKDA